MGKPTGFLEIERHDRSYEKVATRLKTWKEFVEPLPLPEVGKQASRCMDCGIPFCHQGCPVNNQIPDFNNLVYRDQWRQALDNLQSTNNFPEFTGRVCPAPCESVLHAEHRRQSGDHQDSDRMPDRGPRMGRGLDRAADVAARHRQADRGGRLRPANFPPAPSNWPALATRRPCSRSPTGSGACSATASPTSRWRSCPSTGASGRWSPRG